MVAAATMPVMTKKGQEKTGPVQGRLLESEIRELDEAAAGMEIPVERGTLVTYIVREWLKRRREQSDRRKAK